MLSPSPLLNTLTNASGCFGRSKLRANPFGWRSGRQSVRLYVGVQSLELVASIVRRETPIHGGVGRVAFSHPGRHFSFDDAHVEFLSYWTVRNGTSPEKYFCVNNKGCCPNCACTTWDWGADAVLCSDCVGQ